MAKIKGFIAENGILFGLIIGFFFVLLSPFIFLFVFIDCFGDLLDDFNEWSKTWFVKEVERSDQEEV